MNECYLQTAVSLFNLKISNHQIGHKKWTGAQDVDLCHRPVLALVYKFFFRNFFVWIPQYTFTAPGFHFTVTRHTSHIFHCPADRIRGVENHCVRGFDPISRKNPGCQRRPVLLVGQLRQLADQHFALAHRDKTGG